MKVSLLDYGGGNVRSMCNAINSLGYQVDIVSTPEDLRNAQKLIFPGVGAFGACMRALQERGFVEELKRYILADKPFFGVCVGLQCLYEGSEESPGVPGLGIIKGIVKRFDSTEVSVPHMGWNSVTIKNQSKVVGEWMEYERVYYVHSYAALAEDTPDNFLVGTTNYGVEYAGIVERGNMFATQFHPEKSGVIGLKILEGFLSGQIIDYVPKSNEKVLGLSKRIIACLDVRSNDNGDIVVTKGDQYDVREENDGISKGKVRNLGKPVDLASRYFLEGADEITFLNITSFRNCLFQDLPILEVLRQTSERVFVPLTIGGGIRDMVDSDGHSYTALDVSSEYFRSGADKVSIGSDAVYSVEKYLETGETTGNSSIEQISRVYGNQAVVISVDARRIYIKEHSETTHHTLTHSEPGPSGETLCWYQCTVKGGREGRDIDVIQLVTISEILGAGEILLNCINKDGTNSGYDIDLIQHVKNSGIRIPVIASSGAGSPQHFQHLFQQCPTVESALAAGIFHRREVAIEEVKDHLRDCGLPIR
eukprot:TRINITY_DN12278_c0_g1_i1.p1 TRINITY_DN12278_c0_g1~~TRINITY_DN12278_c0_g1_i1.p1  ORF type:complete len:536 (+),score=125.94 TRINITY_DN12278_c0_g1_i1:252-1859(+)